MFRMHLSSLMIPIMNPSALKVCSERKAFCQVHHLSTRKKLMNLFWMRKKEQKIRWQMFFCEVVHLTKTTLVILNLRESSKSVKR